MGVEAAGVRVVPRLDEDLQLVADLMAVSGMSSAVAPVAPVEIAIFISVMKVDAYYVPRSCILVLFKHVYDSVLGGTCALVGVTGVVM